MKTISLCMIVKNEQDNLKTCLDSICSIVDEIIIVDTGSNDNTIEIAKKFTDKVYRYKWNNDFSMARNYSFSKATKEYILWLDGDDYLTIDNQQKLLKLKNSLDDKIDMYYFLYDFNENYEPFYRERLLKRTNNYQFKGKVHEAIIPFGTIKYENIVINQSDKNKPLNDRNLKIFKTLKKEEFTNRDLYYYARELFRHQKYNQSKIKLKQFIKAKGSKNNENIIDACYLLSLIYQRNNETNEALKILYFTFNYDLPRNNILCEIAHIYFEKKDYNKAIYYYELALKKQEKENFSFIFKDYLGFIPAIFLSLCYDKLQDYKKGYEYNELANKFKPNNPYYQNNKDYFKSKIAKLS